MAIFYVRAVLAVLLVALQPAALASSKCKNGHWVDIWGTMPQLVEPANLPNPPYNGSNVVFENATIRQTIFVTQDASTVRLRVSNAFGGSDLPITAITLALPANATAGAGTSDIAPKTLRNLTFSGHPDFIVPNGALVVSDPVDFPVRAQGVLTVSIYLATGQTTNSITGHPGSRTTSYYAPGNVVAAADLTSPAVQQSEHWYFISALEGWLPRSSGALVIVGDSITDGRGSTTNGNDRWPDQLLARMRGSPGAEGAARSVAVVNQAAGGNRVLADGLGPNALGRVDRDVLAQPGLRYAMVFEGVNDIGTAAADAASQEAVGARLVAALDQVAARVHAAGWAAFGCTITPFSGPGQAYSDPAREATRQRVNAWIRGSGRFDAVVDFDAAARDPANETEVNPLYNSGDYLHLNPAGYKALAEAVDLSLFERFKDGVSRMT
ncbi:SGNH hydrolase [Pleurostoma richardsiae]|uniref:SGNH hydrolase n=1 Tax=Pleurostoma richardsiae TaxID=41990 RepID=A0AA38RVY7_9PEZI|nr:SGNH hydrolase [Pleurostoma richardsiae]